MTPVLLVDDHALFAKAVELGLRAAGVPAQRVVPRSAAQILAAADEAGAATVLLDLRLGTGEDGEPLDGLDLVGSLTAHGYRVVVVTARPATPPGGRPSSGARSPCCPRTPTCPTSWPCWPPSPPASRCSTRDGGRTCWPPPAGPAARRRRGLSPFEQLSQREDEVLRALADGQSAAAVAASAYVSEATVRTQIRAILTKLGVSSPLQAVALARRAGWLDRAPTNA